ncbi:TSUP family transporter [Halopseudomonas pachastrellae]|nr:TSUP family transporter [Halopseudomonas pachastrellae]
MSELLPLLLPDNLAPHWALILILAAAFTSAVTAAMGAGGGVMLLAIMALIMPAAAIIPVHGMVQLGSNANRALMTWRHINMRVIAWFAPGVVLGALAASLLLVRLPLAVVQLSIALLFCCCVGASNTQGSHRPCRHSARLGDNQLSQPVCRRHRAIGRRFHQAAASTPAVADSRHLCRRHEPAALAQSLCV